MKNVAWKLVPDPFLNFKESTVKRNMRRLFSHRGCV